MSAITFKIDRVNINRMRRGADGVEMAVYEDGTKVDLLWVSPSDIRKNIKTFGPCEAFTVALECYKFRTDARQTKNEVTIKAPEKQEKPVQELKHWKKKDLQFITNNHYFPNCIECSEHWIDGKQHNYFHKDNCQRGHGKKWEIITNRLDERLAVFEKKHGIDGKGGISCRECSNVAVGFMRVFFHNRRVVVEEWAVCMDHATHEDDNGRESEFKPFKATGVINNAFDEVLEEMVEESGKKS